MGYVHYQAIPRGLSRMLGICTDFDLLLFPLSEDVRQVNRVPAPPDPWGASRNMDDLATSLLRLLCFSRTRS
jgi:hypothetical protein